MRLKQKKGTVRQKGQSTIEYILLVTAVITVLLIFLMKGGVFERAYNNTIQKQGDDMLNTAMAIFN